MADYKNIQCQGTVMKPTANVIKSLFLLRSMKSWLLMALFVLLVACAPAQKAVPAEPAPVALQEAEADALLAVQHGQVWVNAQLAEPGTALKEGDVVKTSEGAEATVVFFDSSVLRLSANTEIMVKRFSAKPRLVQVRQIAGDTWSRVLRISGVVDYEIETPNTIATVRGTGFKISVTERGTEIGVKEGAVHVAATIEGRIVAEQVIGDEQEAAVEGAVIELAPIEPDPWIAENLAEDEQFIEEAREEFVEEHAAFVEDLHEQGLSEEEVAAFTEHLMTGTLTEEEQQALSTEQQAVLEAEGIDVEPEVAAPPAEPTIPAEEIIPEPLPDVIPAEAEAIDAVHEDITREMNEISSQDVLIAESSTEVMVDTTAESTTDTASTPE